EDGIRDWSVTGVQTCALPIFADLGERVRLVHPRGEVVARRAAAFAALGDREVGLVVDSCGMIAVVLDRSSAAGELGLQAGDEIGDGRAAGRERGESTGGGRAR